MTEKRSYLQPHEGVIGKKNPVLLNVSDEALAMRDIIIGLGHHLRSATLVGNPAPRVQRMYARITNPQPGDFVVEETRGLITRDQELRAKSSGILLLHRDEWWQTDEEFEKDLRENIEAEAQYGGTTEEDIEQMRADRAVDHAWYVQYGPRPADICRWTNCSFIAIPMPDEEFNLSVGFRDGNSVVITRDSLLDGLADSGFDLNVQR